MSKYLLEIGVEEFPSAYIASTRRQLKEKFEKLLEENKFSYEKVLVESTPRRFAILLDGVAEKAEGEEKNVKGPSKKIAYDEAGDPQKPLLGFLRGQGADLSDVYFDQVKGEDYVFIHKKEDEVLLQDLLKENVYPLVKSLSFPRSMRWGGKSIRFARPIRWFLSLLDNQVLPFEAEGISVSNITKGHRVLGKSQIVVEDIDQYVNLLRENYVILRQQERRDLIVRGLNQKATAQGGSFLKDDDLLEEVVNIVEYPTVLLGDFDREYLKLPLEVITTPMKDQQRYFPVVDDDKNLLPYFLIVRNGDDRASENVINGNKRVLVARLEDAIFFYDQDNKKKLEDYVEDLKKLSFFEDLGNMYQKTQRLVDLSASLVDDFSLGDDIKENLKRAAYLSKADLVTKMVVEFTDLQGTMGRIYAKNSGENDQVAKAIEEHYLPRYQGDALPSSTLGIVLSAADKLDTICGHYAVGDFVTGSQDPYGLRRAAIGLLNIILKNDIDVDLRDLIKDSFYEYADKNELVIDFEKTQKKILDFFMERLRTILEEDGARYDLINAVLATGTANPVQIKKKIQALTAFLDENTEEKINYFTRLSQLTKDFEGEEVDEALLGAGAERDFYQAISSLSFDDKYDHKDYLGALEEIYSTVDLGNSYLDNTMINVEDEALRNNRKALIDSLSKRLRKIFEVSEIVK